MDYLGGHQTGGTQVKTNMEEFSAECHSVDCSGDSKVLTELDSNKVEVRIRIRSKSASINLFTSSSV